MSLSASFCPTPEQLHYLETASQPYVDPNEITRPAAARLLALGLPDKARRRENCQKFFQPRRWSDNSKTVDSLCCNHRFHKTKKCAERYRKDLLDDNEHLFRMDDGRHYCIIIATVEVPATREVLESLQVAVNTAITRELDQYPNQKPGVIAKLHPYLKGEGETTLYLAAEIFWYGPHRSVFNIQDTIESLVPQCAARHQSIHGSCFKRDLEIFFTNIDEIPDDDILQSECEALFDRRRQFFKFGAFYGKPEDSPSTTTVSVSPDLSVIKEPLTDKSPSTGEDAPSPKAKDGRIWRRTEDGRLVYLTHIASWRRGRVNLDAIPESEWLPVLAQPPN